MTTILLISGSTRAGSTNTAVLRTAPAVAPAGVVTVLYGDLAALPAFDPDDDHDPLPASVQRLRQQIRDADGVLICTPEYAGGLPGSFKNLLDWTVGGTAVQGKPVGWLNVSSVAAPTQGADAHASLARVLRYVDADVVEAACRRAPMRRSAVDEDGHVTDPEVLNELRRALAALAQRSSPREEPPRVPEDPPGDGRRQR